VLVATLAAWLGLRPPSEAERQFLTSLRRRIADYDRRIDPERFVGSRPEEEWDGSARAGQPGTARER
jgi:hypothetical protein